MLLLLFSIIFLGGKKERDFDKGVRPCEILCKQTGEIG